MLVGVVAVGIVLVAVARRAARGTWVVDRDRVRTGLALVLVGLGLLVLVRALNDGTRPSTKDALRTAGRSTFDADGSRVDELERSTLWVLGDVVAWPAPLPLATVVGLPHLVLLTGVAIAGRLPRRGPSVTRLELTDGQLWWDAPPSGDEQLEVRLPGGMVRARSARLGVEVRPGWAIVVVIEGSATVAGPKGDVEVEAGHGLGLTDTGPVRTPEPLTMAEVRDDPWIGPHLAEPAPEPPPLIAVEGRGWPLPAVVSGVVVALMVLSTYVVQVGMVPSGSMSPTLDEGDRVLVAKAAGSPGVGDVVVVERPPSMTDGPVLLVKRVAAVGGQGVAIVDGAVVVDGIDLAEPYLPAGTATEATCDAPVETLVPAGSLYVLGDNRGASFDSRCFGPLPEDAVVGTVVAGVLPPSGSP